MRERVSREEAGAKAKHLAKQLGEKDGVIKKQDTFCREQLAGQKDRSSEFHSHH